MSGMEGLSGLAISKVSGKLVAEGLETEVFQRSRTSNAEWKN